MRLALLAAAVLLLSAFAADASAVTLVRDGKPLAKIVVSADVLAAEPMVPTQGGTGSPASKTRLAANDLQQILAKMTGATLEIVSEDAAPAGPVILVGQSKRVQSLNLDIPKGQSSARTEDGYTIHCKGDVLVLAGNDEGPFHGSHYAVAEFLNRLGVRWFIPGDFGEVIPQKSTVTFDDVTFTDRPTFPLRTWWCNQLPEMRGPEALWKLRSKMQISTDAVVPVAGDSRLRNYMPDASLVETRPELFGQHMDGRPDPYMPNLSNPESAKLVAEKIIAQFKEEQAAGKTLNGVGFAPDDGLPMDYTPETISTLHQGFRDYLGREGLFRDYSTSEEWFTFINRVAEHVEKEYPDQIIATNGYANRGLPPEGMTLHQHVAVMYAPIWADTTKPFFSPNSWHGHVQGAQLKRWTELSNLVYLYNYNITMLVSALAPVPQVRRMATNYRYYKDWGVFGFFNEAKQPWMEEGIVSRYTRAKLMWKADLDLDAHLSAFYSEWYGPAGEDVQGFYDTLENALLESPMLGHEDRILPYIYTNEMVEKCRTHIEAAEAKATAEPHKTRVHAERLIFETLASYMAYRDAEFAGNYADCVRHLERMLDVRAQLHAISPWLAMPPADTAPHRYYSGDSYWGQNDRRAYYQKLTDMTTGKTGDLVVMAPKTAKFALDHVGMGKDLRWYDPAFDRSSWRDIDVTAPFYLQGYMTDDGQPLYDGKMWYVWDLDVPASAQGKPVSLYAPIVTCEAWVWVNGQYVGHRPYLDAYIRPCQIDMDITAHIKPGEKNTIAVWVETGTYRSQAPEGFMSRLFLYSPKK